MASVSEQASALAMQANRGYFPTGKKVHCGENYLKYIGDVLFEVYCFCLSAISENTKGSPQVRLVGNTAG